MTVLEILRALVGFDTTSSRSNLEVVHFVADYLDARGCAVELLENDHGTKANLLARAGPDDGEGLLLSGHLDVVPATEPEWRTDPFTLHETDDAYYGRGTADMKGFDSLAVHAMAEAAGRSPRHGLALLLSYDEELGLGGAQAFADSWDDRRPLPANALIGEPTELRVVRAQKGYLTFRVVLRGVSAHSAYPDLGTSAIEHAAVVVRALTGLGEELRGESVPSSPLFPDYPHATLNVARIEGGDALNVVPDRCVIEGSARILPGHKLEEFLGRIREAVGRGAGRIAGGGREKPDAGGREEVAGGGSEDVTLELLDYSPPMLAGEDARVHRELCDLMGQTGSCGVSYASDAGPLAAMGIETVLWGPGTIEVAHKPNEHIPKDQLERAGKVLARLVERFCFE